MLSDEYSATHRSALCTHRYHRMRILVALTYYRPHVSGLTVYAERLARGLAARGHTVTVLTSRFAPHLQAREMILRQHPTDAQIRVRMNIEEMFRPDETDREITSQPWSSRQRSKETTKTTLRSERRSALKKEFDSADIVRYVRLARWCQ